MRVGARRSQESRHTMESSHIYEGAPVEEDGHFLSADVRPARRLRRTAQDFLCDIVADGLSMEGRTLNLNEQGLAVALSEPVFADLDCVQVRLTAHDGSLFHLTDHGFCDETRGFAILHMDGTDNHISRFK